MSQDLCEISILVRKPEVMSALCEMYLAGGDTFRVKPDGALRETTDRRMSQAR